MTPREALDRIIRLVKVTDDEIGWDWNVAIAEKVHNLAQEALAHLETPTTVHKRDSTPQPVRNCDTVSGDNPYEYQNKWCKAVAGSVKPEVYCMNRSCVQCLFRWLVANAEGGVS